MLQTPTRHQQASSRPSRSQSPPSDIEASPSPIPHCLCGVPLHGDGIYCSIACARDDAFSSLCFKEATFSHSRMVSSSSMTSERPPSPPSSHNSYMSSISSQAHSYRESSVSDCPSDAESAADWNASHYRRMAREELRREERRAERKRRRADAAPSSISSSSGRVPDLIGGNGYHSRNSSVATTSSIATYSSRGTSYLSESSLSRNPSTASNSKRLAPGFGHGGFKGIREDDDEQEWLDSSAQPIHVPSRRPESRTRSNSKSKPKVKPVVESATFGMGKDMRDVLDDILRMEQGFIVEDAQPGEGVELPFVKNFAGRMPRTPSPAPTALGNGRVSRQLGFEPPPAPLRATHRSNRSQPIELSSPSFPLANAPTHLGHQTSLSESHTLLLQLSAEPESACSPARRSMSFTPTSAYPAFLASSRPLASPALTVTPPRRYRRPANPTPPSPTVHHPAMSHWRFPASASTTSFATTEGALLASSITTPTRRQYGVTPTKTAVRLTSADGPSALLWPPPNLQPSLFPQSPAGDTPRGISPPRSGLRLGVLCGSGNGSGSGSDEEMATGMDVDVDVDVNDEAEINEGMEGIGRAMGFLPDLMDDDEERW